MNKNIKGGLLSAFVFGSMVTINNFLDTFDAPWIAYILVVVPLILQIIHGAKSRLKEMEK